MKKSFRTRMISLSLTTTLATMASVGMDAMAQAADSGPTLSASDTARIIINHALIPHDFDLKSNSDQQEFFNLIDANANRKRVPDAAAFKAWWLAKVSHHLRGPSVLKDLDWEYYFIKESTAFRLEKASTSNNPLEFITWMDNVIAGSKKSPIGHEAIRWFVKTRKAAVDNLFGVPSAVTLASLTTVFFASWQDRVRATATNVYESVFLRISEKELAEKSVASRKIKGELADLRTLINSPQYDFTLNTWTDNSSNLKNVHAETNQFFSSLPKRVKNGREMLAERAKRHQENLVLEIRNGMGVADGFRRSAEQSLMRIEGMSPDRRAVVEVGERLYHAVGEMMISEKLNDGRTPAIKAQVEALQGELVRLNATPLLAKSVRDGYRSMFAVSSTISQTLASELYYYNDFDQMLDNMKSGLNQLRDSNIAHDDVSTRMFNADLAADLTDYLDVVELDIDKAMKSITEISGPKKARKVLGALDKANDSVVTERAKSETGRAGEKETPESLVKHAAFEAAKK